MKKYISLLSFIVLSFFGTTLTSFSLGIWILNTSQSTVEYSFISFFSIVPQILLSPFIGSIVDAWDKRKVIILGQAVAGIGSLIMLLSFWGGQLEAGHIMIISFVSSTALGFVKHAFYVSAAVLVPQDKLNSAKGLEQTGIVLVTLFVPVVAPFIYTYFGLGTVFFIDVLSFSVSIIVFLLIRITSTSEEPKKLTISEDAKMAWEFFRARPGLSSLLVYFFASNFLLGGITIMITPLLLDFSDEKGLAITMACASVGGMLGGLVMSTYQRFSQPISLIFNANLVIGILLFSAALIPISAVAFGGLAAVIMFISIASQTVSDTLWQSIVPYQIQGRVLGYKALITGAAIPLSYLVAGVAIEQVAGTIMPYLPINKALYPGTDRTIAILLLLSTVGGLHFLYTLRLKHTRLFVGVNRLYQYGQKVT